jgi:hypothetical protein
MVCSANALQFGFYRLSHEQPKAALLLCGLNVEY